MPKTNKIIQHGLETEVRELADAGFSRETIAKHINIKHNDEGVNVSHMSIQRFLESDVVKDIQKDLMEGNNPEDSLRTEFREKMYDLDDEMHLVLKETRGVCKESKRLLKKLKNSDDVTLIINALRQVDSSLKNRITAVEQIRKDWHTFIEQGYRQFGRIDDAKKNNYTQVNNQLIVLSSKLCPKCRKEVIDLITLKEEQNG